MHVDGAYGLPAAALPSRAELLRRARRAPIPARSTRTSGCTCRRRAAWCSCATTQALASAFAHEQGYLPHQQHELHAADITLEYSRPFRALKLWLAFRAHGAAQFREAIERNLAEADLLYRRAQLTEDFEVMEAPPQLSIVPLRHVPPGVADINAHNQALAEAIQADGRVYLASALIDGEVWLRPCFVNFRTTEDDVIALLDVARELGESLARGGHARVSSTAGVPRRPAPSRRRRAAARRAQGAGRARAPAARLPRDVGDLEPVPQLGRDPAAHGSARCSPPTA